MGNGCLLEKTSSLINNTLVIQKTVGVTDGWCFFLCGPVSRKIVEACVLMSREDASLKVPETWEEGADKSGSAFLDIQRLSHLLHKKRCGGKKDLWPQSRLRAPFFDSHGWSPSTFPGSTPSMYQFGECGHGLSAAIKDDALKPLHFFFNFEHRLHSRYERYLNWLDRS